MKRLMVSFVDHDTIDIGGVKEYEVDSGVLWVLFEDGRSMTRKIYPLQQILEITECEE